MGAWTFSRALLWAFATHGALVGVLATKTRLPTVPIGELATIELETMEQAPVQAEPPSEARPAPEPAAPSARAPRPNPTVTTKSETRGEPTKMTAAASDDSALASGTSESAEATGTESAARPQTAAASSHSLAPVRGPVLLGRDGCRRYFPHDAQSEEGTVTIAVDVSPTGEAAGTRIVQESPVRNGFGQAAARCATSLHFAPAIGESGVPVQAVATLELHFARPRRRDALSLR